MFKYKGQTVNIYQEDGWFLLTCEIGDKYLYVGRRGSPYMSEQVLEIAKLDMKRKIDELSNQT